MNTFNSIKVPHILNMEYLKWGVGILGLILTQISVLKHVAITWSNIIIMPDITLVALFFFGTRNSAKATIIAGFAAGLTLDALGGGFLGMNAFSKTIGCFLIGFIPLVHRIQKLLQFCLFFLLISVIHDMAYNVIYTINNDISAWRLFFVHSLPSSLYSVVIAGIAFYWLKK